MKNPVRWGVMGAAWIAVGRVIAAMQQSEDCEVIAIASRDQAKADEAAKSLGIPHAYGSYEAMLANKEIEAVYIPLPNTMHVDWSIRALEAGKHVLCEKPIGMSAEEARRLLPVRDRTGLLMEEGFPFVNHPQWQFIWDEIKNGAIGDVVSVDAVMAYNNRKPNDLRNNPNMGGGALYDAGCYVINCARLIFRQEPTHALALLDIDPEFGVDRSCSIILQFPGGGSANLLVSTQAGTSPKGTHQHVGILGRSGWMRCDFPFSAPEPTACNVYQGDASSWGTLVKRVVPFPALNQYQLQAERFSRLVRGEPATAWPVENGIANLKVMDALFRSAKSQKLESV